MSLLDIPAFVPQVGAARRVRPMGPPEPEEESPPARTQRASTLPPAPPLPPAKETAMPKGVYPRKSKGDQPGAEAKAVTQKPKKAKAKKARAKPAKVAARLASTSNSEPNFVVDDAGRVAIIDGTTRIDLSVSATKRLALFIDRTKGFRT